MTKKRISVIIVSLFLLVTAVVLCACDNLGGSILPKSPDIGDSVVRIHIRANSNSEEDQSVKLKVRDAVTAYLTDKLDGCSDKSDALAALSREKDNLQNIAQNVLYNNGYDYKARVVLSREHFPEITYGEYVFPEGDYDALLVLLGEGVGDNWWCVAFPPLCFVPSNGSEQIQYKSWVKELLDKIFG